MLFSFVGFLIIYTFYATGKMQSSPFLIILFSTTLSLSVGMLWEIVEFLIDLLLGGYLEHAMQPGLLDTMQDLIADTLGALVIAVLTYIHLKSQGVGFFKYLIMKFYKRNPKIKILKKMLNRLK